VAALRGTQRTLQLCQRLGYASEKLCVVVNRYDSSDVVSLADAAKVLEREIFFRIPNDYRTSTGAINKGVPVVEYDAASPLSRSFANLTAKLGGATASVDANGNGQGSRLGRIFGMGRKH
jgi:pilus assembly protein CpaE